MLTGHTKNPRLDKQRRESCALAFAIRESSHGETSRSRIYSDAFASPTCGAAQDVLGRVRKTMWGMAHRMRETRSPLLSPPACGLDRFGHP